MNDTRMESGLFSRRSFLALSAMLPWALQARASTSLPVGLELYSVQEALKLDPTASIVFEELTDLYIQTNQLRSAVTQLMGAVAQSAYTSNDEQQERIVDIVNNARREIYQILGESD